MTVRARCACRRWRSQTVSLRPFQSTVKRMQPPHGSIVKPAPGGGPLQQPAMHREAATIARATTTAFSSCIVTSIASVWACMTTAATSRGPYEVHFRNRATSWSSHRGMPQIPSNIFRPWNRTPRVRTAAAAARCSRFAQ